VWEVRNAYKILVVKPEWKRYSKCLEAGGRITLKLISGKEGGTV
jgi:hypothetical protein